MADLIALLLRATDEDLNAVADATAYFYEAGSSTPLVVYTDNTLATPRGTSVAADANGVFPQCWVAAGTAVKVNIVDEFGVPQPGFPQDNYPRFSDGGQSASDVVFGPVVGNTETNAQDAIAANVTRLNSLDNGAAIYSASGSSGAYAITTGFTITAYSNPMEFEFRANHVNIGGGSDSLNVDAIGAVTLKRISTANAKENLAAGDLQIGQVVRVKYDGTDFIVTSPLNAGETTKGVVEAATTAEMTAATAGKYPDAAKVAAYVTTATARGYDSAVTTSGTSFDFTIPTTAREIVLGFNGVTLSGTDDILVQLGDSGGVETSGYVSGSFTDNVNYTSTSGFVVGIVASSGPVDGAMRLSGMTSSGQTWTSSHGVRNGNLGGAGGGSKVLSAALTTVRVTRTGTDTFTAGSITVAYR